MGNYKHTAIIKIFKTKMFIAHCGSVAHSGERKAVNLKVVGSKPTRAV